MRNPGGYAVWSDPDLPTIEMDTITCTHCNSVVFVRTGKPDDAGGFCMKCFRHLCATCADSGKCEPYERQMEKMEKQITQNVERDRALERLLRSGT